MGGTHIVLDRASVVRMNSATNGVPVNSADGYDELVYDDVHISDSGEYVHAAPWSVNNQGNANVSHGCINLSPTDAKAFFDFSQVGDVVLVSGGPRPPAFGDHGVMDWSSDWGEYTPTP
jgi:lipoprotein-anchoring transpeptidase ErfK/SrfK